MLLRKFFCSLGLTLVLVQSALAQSGEEAPNVRYTGFVSSGGQSRAVVLSVDSDSQYVIATGQKLGGYQVDSVGPDKIVLVSPSGSRFELANQAAAGTAGSSPLFLRIDQAGLVYTAKAIAATTGCGMFVCEGSEGVGSYSGGAQDAPDALSKLAVFSPGLTSEVIDGPGGPLWIIGQEEQIEAVEAALHASPHGGKDIVFDFAFAELGHVLKVLAREMGVTLVAEEEYDWGITVYNPQAMPAEDMLAMIVADTTLAYRLKGKKLYVGQPGWVSQQK